VRKKDEEEWKREEERRGDEGRARGSEAIGTRQPIPLLSSSPHLGWITIPKPCYTSIIGLAGYRMTIRKHTGLGQSALAVAHCSLGRWGGEL